MWPASLNLHKCKTSKVQEYVYTVKNSDSYKETTMAYIMSEASCDVRIFLFGLSSTGILSRIKLNFRIACWNIIRKVTLCEQTHDFYATQNKPFKPLFGSGRRFWGLLPTDQQDTGRTPWFCVSLQKYMHVAILFIETKQFLIYIMICFFYFDLVLRSWPCLINLSILLLKLFI